MNHDPRPHIHRRRRAIGRLRSLTTGAAVAGLAGTAGFGVLAAATWSGTPGAVGANSATSDGSGDGIGGSNQTSGSTGGSGSTRVGATRTPTTGGTAQQPLATPRLQRVSGGGHASTGGSH